MGITKKSDTAQDYHRVRRQWYCSPKRIPNTRFTYRDSLRPHLTTRWSPEGCRPLQATQRQITWGCPLAIQLGKGCIASILAWVLSLGLDCIPSTWPESSPWGWTAFPAPWPESSPWGWAAFPAPWPESSPWGCCVSLSLIPACARTPQLLLNFSHPAWTRALVCWLPASGACSLAWYFTESLTSTSPLIYKANLLFSLILWHILFSPVVFWKMSRFLQWQGHFTWYCCHPFPKQLFNQWSILTQGLCYTHFSLGVHL